MDTEVNKLNPHPETGQDAEQKSRFSRSSSKDHNHSDSRPDDNAGRSNTTNNKSSDSDPNSNSVRNNSVNSMDRIPNQEVQVNNTSDCLNKPGTSNSSVKDSTTEEEFEYESEPASMKSLENRRKRKLLLNSQGKTMYPVSISKTSARELRELTRKHFRLEKNLKIEGIPDQPKIRKRRMSLSANMGRDKDIQHKRKRLLSVDRPKKGHMPNWGSFGGDATDPLNLNGLAHSEEGRLLNLKTPENSPLPTPDFRKIVYVKVPPNIEDPLNLEGRHDQGYIDMLLNSTRRKRHRAKKHKDTLHQVKDAKPAVAHVKPVADLNPSNSAETKTVEKTLQPPSPEPASKPKVDSGTPQKLGAAVNRSRSRSLSTSPDRKLKRQLSGAKGSKPYVNEPKKFPEKPMFTQGNYNRYYGYRNRDHESDPRLRYFNPRLFENKDILDIGCNVGHVTLAIAEHFRPRKVLGMDIDGKLIAAARQNMRHMLSQRRKDSSKYPSVLEMTRGPLEVHPLTGPSNVFPNNILFLQGNYVPGSEDILRLQKEEYDTILALSITKWIHLNNGDHGLKLFFQKIVNQLRPGGHLILEPQPWSTYRKRAKLAPELFKHYSSIKLKPEGFKNYLLSIGFAKCEVIGVPVTKAKGFRRPLILFTKADRSNSSNNQIPTSLPTCTECLGDQSECDHIQFTGMRRGAYADRLYDHISYHPSTRMPDLNSSSCSYAGGKSFLMPSPSSSAFMNYSPLIDMAPCMPSSSFSPNLPGLALHPVVVGGSSASRSGSRHRSESVQSGSTSSSGSSSSHSSSQSSGGGSSSSSSSSSYTEDSSPLVNGGMAAAAPAIFAGGALIMNEFNGGVGGLNGGAGDFIGGIDLNGGVAEEIEWVNNEVNVDGGVEVDIPLEQQGNNGINDVRDDDLNSSGQLNSPGEPMDRRVV